MSIYGAPICFVTIINKHWVAIWVSNQTIEVYDGLGEKSGLTKNKYFINFLNNNLINRELKLSREIQSINSVLCGQLCVICLTMCSREKTFEEINSIFDCDQENNDVIIHDLFQNL